QSMIWMLENILTAPSSRATGLDIFRGDREQRFWSNIELSDAAEKVRAIKGRSQESLRQLPLDSFDIIYIDGSHRARDVLLDLALSWDLLKVGGVMIMDDYAWERQWPATLRPEMAIDAFLSMHGGVVDVIEVGAQVIVRRKAETCTGRNTLQCVELGPYLYFMRSGELLHAETRAKVDLTEKQRLLVEDIARAVRYDQNGLMIPKKLRARREFAGLLERLEPGTWPAIGR
ncbi:MAG: class I SAM-dependent methyltransferase, partial [Acidobacteriota bacterium]